MKKRIAGSEQPEISALAYRDKPDSVPKLTLDQVRVLVRKILKYDDDESSRALAALVSGIGYERDAVDRDGLALWSVREAFSYSMQHSHNVDEFVTDAATDAALLSEPSRD